MDQEGGRRRSTRLAARGVSTPKTETPVKKTIKSSEKPKRAKRKTVEEVVELPDTKKSKTEDETSFDTTDKPENKTNNVEQNDVSSVTPMDEDNKEENDKPAVVEKADVSIQDSKEQTDKNSASNDKEENIDLALEEKQPEVTKEPEIVEQLKNDVSQEKPLQEPVALENTNGKIDDKKTVESVKEINNDNGFCVAAKDITPNGDTDTQIKSTTNGDELVMEPEAIEPTKVIYDNTNHVAETDLKTVTTPPSVNTTTNNDVSGVEQVAKELDKVVDNAVDSVTVSADDNAPKVDQSSTVVS